MDSNIITAIATGLLAIVGIAQIGILKSQRRHSQLELIGEYRQRWDNNRVNWGTVVFVGRSKEEYYQVLPRNLVDKCNEMIEITNNHEQSTWALDAARPTFGILSDICSRVLQGQLEISLIYPIFGTELLRHSRPLRTILDSSYSFHHFLPSESHLKVRTEIQDWLIYHDGTRRRCLILIDLLWAEAARLEDLPPSDMKSGADAKTKTGKGSRKRLSDEYKRLNRSYISLLSIKLSRYLINSEYRRFYSRVGISKKRLEKLDRDWTERLLYNHRK